MFDMITSVLKTVLYESGDLIITIFELIALAMICIAGIRGFILYCKKDENTSIELLKGFSIGLSFLLGGEILKTVIVLHDITELIIVGGLVIIRVAISILIHWEIVQEKKEHDLEIEKEERSIIREDNHKNKAS